MLPKLICYFRCNVCFLYFSTKSLWKSFKDRGANRFRFVSECKIRARNHSDKIFSRKILRKIEFWGNFGEIHNRNAHWELQISRDVRNIRNIIGHKRNRGKHRYGRRVFYYLTTATKLLIGARISFIRQIL